MTGSYGDIIAVVNKCDEKMAEKGQWSNESDWTDFWETANKKADTQLLGSPLGMPSLVKMCGTSYVLSLPVTLTD